MARPLTQRQQNVYDFIVKTIHEMGYPPTRAEIARALGFRSPNAAEEHLRALERKGVIRMIAGTSRGIRLPAQEQEESEGTPPSQGLPIIGEVAAGSPILAAEHIDRYCPLPPEYFTPRADYLLKVRDGQIVVARLEDEVTVKRFQRSGHRVTLFAENADFPPIEVDLRHQALEIEGIGVGVIRGGNGQALA